MRRLWLLLLVTCPLAVAPTQGRAEEVDMALVLVTDVSRSIDDGEFATEKDGYRTAFSDPHVLAAIAAGPLGTIAVSYIEFAGQREVRTVVGWTIVRDEATAKALTEALSAAPRSYWGRSSISAGIDGAVRALTDPSITTGRKVIDVAGDGTNNAGRDASEARDEAVAAGVTINGLAIINDHPISWSFAHVQPPGGLDNWYRENVAGGPSSFVVAIHDFHDFGEALTRKLVNEIADLNPHPHKS